MKLNNLKFLALASLAVGHLGCVAAEESRLRDDCQLEAHAKACADSYDSNAPERLRFEIEVVGHGEVVVLEPEEQRCTGDIGLCSFSFPEGSRVVVQADFAVEGASGWEDACSGRGRCEFFLEEDSVVVASFESGDRPWDSLRPKGLLPGQPGTVTDPMDVRSQHLRPDAREGLGAARE